MDTTTQNTKKTNLKIKGIWIAFIICIAIVAGTFNSIFSYVALILSVIAIVSLSEEESLSLLVFAMPFANIFKVSPESQSFFTYLLLFYVLWLLVKRRNLQTPFLLAFMLLFSFIMMQTIISLNVTRMVKFVANILLIYLAVNIETKNDNKTVYLYYMFGFVISSLVSILNIIPNLSDYIIAKDLGYFYEGMERFSGLYGDPNYYSVNLIISLCLIVILHNKKQLNTIVSLVLAGFMVTFAIMTYSKSAFIMLFVPLLFLFYSKIKRRRFFALAILVTVGIIFATSFLAGRIEALNIIIQRFMEVEEGSSLTTGRADLWARYIDHLGTSTMDMLFGVGFGGNLLGNEAPHNTYIDSLYYLGLTGTVLLLSVFIVIVRSMKLQHKKNILNYSVLISILLMYFFLSELFYFDWAPHIIMALFVMRTNMIDTPNEGNL